MSNIKETPEFYKQITEKFGLYDKNVLKILVTI